MSYGLGATIGTCSNPFLCPQARTVTAPVVTPPPPPQTAPVVVRPVSAPLIDIVRQAGVPVLKGITTQAAPVPTGNGTTGGGATVVKDFTVAALPVGGGATTLAPASASGEQETSEESSGGVPSWLLPVALLGVVVVGLSRSRQRSRR